MSSKLAITGLIVAALATGGIGQFTPPARAEMTLQGAERLGHEEEDETTAESSRKPVGRVLEMDEAVMKKLDELPPDQVIEIEGKPITVEEIRAKNRLSQKSCDAKTKAMASEARSRFEAYRAKFEKGQQAELDAANAKVRAELARRSRGQSDSASAQVPAGSAGIARRGQDAPSSPRLEAIRKEAREIQSRRRAGTPDPKDEQRARELFEEYQRLQP